MSTLSYGILSLALKVITENDQPTIPFDPGSNTSFMAVLEDRPSLSVH